MPRLPFPARAARLRRAARGLAVASGAALLLLSGAALTASGAGAQTDYGSVYSRFALGERFDLSTSQADAMGVNGVAIRAGLYNGLSNPAHAADQTLTTLSASALVRGVRATDATDATSDATAADLGLVQLGVPLSPGRVGLTLAYRPYTRVDYRAAEEGEVPVDGTEPTRFRANLEGSGGLQKISAGLGVRVGSALTVGASGEAILGTVEYLQRTEFPDVGDAFFQTRESETTKLWGFTGSLGAAVSTRRLLGEADALTFAASVTLPTTLRGSRSTTLGTSLDRDTLSTQDSGEARLPLTARTGLAYRTGPKLLLAADAVYEPWGDFSSDFRFGGYDPASGESALRDRLRVGGGLEWTPAGVQRGAGYFRRVAYRLGGYTETGLAAPEAQGVRTYALTGGLSLPTRLAGSRVDLGFEVGTRGEASGVLVRDTFWRGTLTFNFGERWFVRRRLG